MYLTNNTQAWKFPDQMAVAMAEQPGSITTGVDPQGEELRKRNVLQTHSNGQAVEARREPKEKKKQKVG